MRILEIKIIEMPDADPDTSYFGVFTDRCFDGYIVATGEHEGEFVEDLPEDAKIPRGREYRYFQPYAGGEKVGSENYRKYAMQDYERMQGLNRGDWGYIGIKAEADVVLSESNIVQKISSGGIWGVESDSGDYIKEVAEEELKSLETELLAIGFSKEEIEEARPEDLEPTPVM